MISSSILTVNYFVKLLVLVLAIADVSHRTQYYEQVVEGSERSRCFLSDWYTSVPTLHPARLSLGYQDILLVPCVANAVLTPLSVSPPASQPPQSTFTRANLARVLLFWYSGYGGETHVSLDCSRFYGPIGRPRMKMNEWMNGWINERTIFLIFGNVEPTVEWRTRRETRPSDTLSTTNPTGLARAWTQAGD
jgi:hypothetical protein